MVALSVSISASMSPFFTVSPTFLCHSAITPSVMVSLNLGIRITSSILDRSGEADGGAVDWLLLAAAAFGEGVAAGAAAGELPAERFPALPFTREEMSSPGAPIIA